MNAIDLAKVPPPDIIEIIDYEQILADMASDLKARDSSLGNLLESDPATKILEVAAYREMQLRNQINNAARACMLAYSTGSDLDNLAANFNVIRLLTSPGDPNAVPPIEPSYETDGALRYRTQLALEGITTAGSRASYEFHARRASGQIKSVSITRPAPGQVLVNVLSRTGDGAASDDLIQQTAAALNAEHVRPLCDSVTVASSDIVRYSISATLTFYPGPDRSLVLTDAQRQVRQYTSDNHYNGYDITLSGLYAALHRPGVQKVVIHDPIDGITIQPQQAAYCTNIELIDGGTDE